MQAYSISLRSVENLAVLHSCCCQLCALSTFGLADCLKCLVDQGFLDKVKVDYRDKKEIHVFKMLIEQEQAAVHVGVTELVSTVCKHQ